ncbi:hypothetical protein BCR34DRAFT_252694 [Clohesyomyces aquaticus]|uniref:Uncharacterized protein n=1 Tax=Clohesyomyces aquaticus TaxID=1231657 RepID=A0A1Y1ZUA8_9PLEO|nr:hypothetical protein BCR34DRAFT_252694 [Clohesyomyces aquaticus]
MRSLIAMMFLATALAAVSSSSSTKSNLTSLSSSKAIPEFPSAIFPPISSTTVSPSSKMDSGSTTTSSKSNMAFSSASFLSPSSAISLPALPTKLASNPAKSSSSTSTSSKSSTTSSPLTSKSSSASTPQPTIPSKSSNVAENPFLILVKISSSPIDLSKTIFSQGSTTVSSTTISISSTSESTKLPQPTLNDTIPSTACTCDIQTPPGLYCGYCSQILSCDQKNNNCWTGSFSCNSQGGCMNYGRLEFCEKESSTLNKLNCPYIPIP